MARRKSLIERDPIEVVADYRRSPLGLWQVVVTANHAEEAVLTAASVEDAFMDALDAFDDVSRKYLRPCYTIHTLEGDVAAFAALAEELGLRVPEGRGVGATIWTD